MIHNNMESLYENSHECKSYRLPVSKLKKMSKTILDYLNSYH